MRLTGTLKSWNDDRGFGFIGAATGGREIFVHISAFPRDGSRPTAGELLDYEVGTGKDGKPAATRVYRKVVGQPLKRPHPRVQQAGNRRSFTPKLVALALVIVIGATATLPTVDMSAAMHGELLRRWGLPIWVR